MSSKYLTSEELQKELEEFAKGIAGAISLKDTPQKTKEVKSSDTNTTTLTLTVLAILFIAQIVFNLSVPPTPLDGVSLNLSTFCTGFNLSGVAIYS